MANSSPAMFRLFLKSWRRREFFRFDMSGNVASANNFIRAGYRMFQPHDPWAFPNTLLLAQDGRPSPFRS
jgi:hypothetical protein